MINRDLIKYARQTNLKEYLENKGYTLQKDGINNYKIQELPNVIVSTEGKWYDFGNDKGGKAIDFVVQFENKSFKEAVQTLTNKQITEKEFIKPEIKSTQEPLKAPVRSSEQKRAYSYLKETRGISDRVLKPLMDKGFIYQTEKGNVAFVGTDKNQEIKYCFERSTLSNSDWKGETKGSQKEYSFKIEGQSKTLLVYESPIDLLSHSTLEKGLEGHHRLSLGGLSDKALNQYLKDNRDIEKIVLCLDNDKRGQEATQKLGNKLLDRGFDVKKIEPKNKDFNIDLIEKRKEFKKIEKQKEIQRQEFLKRRSMNLGIDR